MQAAPDGWAFCGDIPSGSRMVRVSVVARRRYRTVLICVVMLVAMRMGFAWHELSHLFVLVVVCCSTPARSTCILEHHGRSSLALSVLVITAAEKDEVESVK